MLCGDMLLTTKKCKKWHINTNLNTELTQIVVKLYQNNLLQAVERCRNAEKLYVFRKALRKFDKENKRKFITEQLHYFVIR